MKIVFSFATLFLATIAAAQSHIADPSIPARDDITGMSRTCTAWGSEQQCGWDKVCQVACQVVTVVLAKQSGGSTGGAVGTTVTSNVCHETCNQVPKCVTVQKCTNWVVHT